MTNAPMLAVAALVTAIGCAGAPKPILYPNRHLDGVGKAAAERDIAECRELADAAGAHRDPSKVTDTARDTATGAAIGAVSGAAGGAIVGSAGRGAAIGAASGATAGLLRSIFRKKPVSQVHIAFVNRCLNERGYDTVGWK